MAEILKYQSGRTLDTVPAFGVALQLRTTASQPAVFLGVKAHGLDIYFDPAPALHYDTEGRLVKWVEPDRYLRRGLSNRVLETVKLPAESGGGIRRRVLQQDAAEALADAAAQKIKPVADALSHNRFIADHAAPNREEALRRIAPLLEKAAAFCGEAARRDAERFFSVYQPVAILPPDQYNALVLQATEGCAHNQCTFCGFYRRTRFRMKLADEFREHVRRVVAYHGATTAMRRGIFLGQANALTIPQARLLEVFRIVVEMFEFPPAGSHTGASWWLGHPARFDGIYSFIDAFTGVLKTADEYRQLRELHLRRVYLGMETGDDDLMRFLNKPATAGDVLETVRRLKQAGLSVAVIILLGAGGERFFEQHTRQTIAVLNQMELAKGDYVYLSPLVDIPGSEYFARAREAGIGFLSPQRMHEQEVLIRSGLSFSNSANRPIIAHYDIEQFVY